jgi:hypothetical protein
LKKEIFLLLDSGVFQWIGSNARANMLFRMYLSMPMLPKEEFINRLVKMRQDIKTLPRAARPNFRQFHDYILNFWIKRVRPERISVFGQERRTNNDLDCHIWQPAVTKINRVRRRGPSLDKQSNNQRLRER